MLFHITASHKPEHCAKDHRERTEALLHGHMNSAKLQRKFNVELRSLAWDMIGHKCYLLVEGDNLLNVNAFCFEVCGHPTLPQLFEIVPVTPLAEMIRSAERVVASEVASRE